MYKEEDYNCIKESYEILRKYMEEIREVAFDGKCSYCSVISGKARDALKESKVYFSEE